MKIVKSNGQYTFYNKIEIIDKLEPKNYIVKHFMGSLYLEETSSFVLPEKLYDVEKKFRDIILKSHFAGNRNTGILLEGYKGQGKTITSKLLCMESGLPVVMIDSKMPQNLDLISFLNEIKQEYVLFIDEFEKIFKSAYNTYDDEGNQEDRNQGFHNQNMFLTLMDGALSNEFKKLFLFTTNGRVDEHFLNRPSRIKWHKSYQFMNSELYSIIIEDKLQNKGHKDDLIMNLPLQEATVDLLTVIIDQINLLDMPYSEFKSFFNHKSDSTKYNLEYIVDDKKSTEFQKLGEIELTSPPIIGTKYISDMYVDKIHAISNDNVVFKSKSLHTLMTKDIRERYKEISAYGFIYKITKVAIPRENLVF